MTLTLQKPTSKSEHGAVLCRAAYNAPAAATAEVMYMPAGLQTITPSQAGRSVTVQVRVDRASAEALEAQRAALESRGKRPYFDFNHEDGEASFWPTEFFWVGDGRSEIADRKLQMADRTPDSGLRSPAAKPPGIYARGEWSDLGQQAITGKRYRQFSPVFYVDDVRANPARIICRQDAKPNMGGLVNDPAFHTILPFWAKDAGASGTTNKPQPGLRPNLYHNMTHEEIAGLRARMNSLEQQAAVLDGADEVARLAHQAELKAARAELTAGEAQRQVESLRARNEALEVADMQRRQASARQYAADMVSRGALAARDHAGIAEVERNMATNPEVFAPIYARWGSNSALANTAGLLSRGTAAERRGYSGVSIAHSDPRTVFGALGALCARQSDESLHVLTRMEIAREFGSIYAREFRGDNGKRILDAPLSAADSTDANLGTLAGTLVTQRTLELLRLQFPVLGRVTTDFSDLPAQFNQTIVSRIVAIPSAQDYDTSTGWTDSAATTTDVPITINKHKGVPITFNQNILASTVRRLFEEFAPASSYALAKSMVDDLYANITDANFTNNTVQATSGFARSNVIDMGTQLTLRGVPQGDMNGKRFAAQLEAEDPTILVGDGDEAGQSANAGTAD